MEGVDFMIYWIKYLMCVFGVVTFIMLGAKND